MMVVACAAERALADLIFQIYLHIIVASVRIWHSRRIKQPAIPPASYIYALLCQIA